MKQKTRFRGGLAGCLVLAGWCAALVFPLLARPSAAAPRPPPAYGPDVRMGNGDPVTTGRSDLQIDINPLDNANAIGVANDQGTAGVAIYRTTDSGTTWTAHDASAYGVPAACCHPGVAYGADGHVYVSVLGNNVAYIIRSADGGATWAGPAQVVAPDRVSVSTDPSDPNVVYLTYSDLGPTNRIKGYKSTDGGVTWGPSFFVGDVAPPQGYEQASQPRVAGNGWLYVGYQQYTNSTTGCSAGVQNVLAKSTDGGVSFTYTVVPIIQGGACSSAQAGRGIFCVNAGGSYFRSRSHPILGVSPTDPTHVYMVYSGGDLESAYTCAGATGFHSDTLFRKSTDGGVTFTAPQKVNSDAQGSDQFLPWMGVTQNGQIWVGWNDRREDPNDFLSRWYQSASTDEGMSWHRLDGSPGNDPVGDVFEQPTSFMGEYDGLSARNGLVLGMWTEALNGAGDAYTDPAVPPPPLATPTATSIAPSATPPPPLTATPTATSAGPSATPAATSTPANTPSPSSTPRPPPVATSSPTPAASPAYTASPVPSSTPAPLTPTSTPAAPAPTSTACGIMFSDVQPGDYFYLPVDYLACHGVISGYGDGTFRPYNNTTRAQMVKIVALGFSLAGPAPAPGGATFADVPPAFPFFAVVEAASLHHVVNGYACGGSGEPCDAQMRPYFRPYANVTRGQLAKITVAAAGWAMQVPASPTFTDVPVGSPFYAFVETAVCHGVLSGYGDGTFRPGAGATRGQIAKIVYLAVTAGGSCRGAPAPR